MKKLITTLALLLSLSTNAAEIDCEQLSSIASTIMESRQAGVKLSKIIKLADSNSLIKEMAVSAYRKPAYNSEEYKQQEISEFANYWYIACLDANSEK